MLDIKTLIFDLDDTILETGVHYWKCIENLGEDLSSLLDSRVPPGDIMRRQEEIDMQEVEYAGFTRERFPRSFVRTYKSYAKEFNLPVTGNLKKKYWDMADAVYDVIPGMLPRALDTLNHLKSKKCYRLVLYTLGDENLQKKKISRHKLSEVFDEINIVYKKDKESLKSIVNGESPCSVAVIGDSLRGEIAPAVALGCKAFYVRNKTPWLYLISVEVPGDYITLNSISELREYL